MNSLCDDVVGDESPFFCLPNPYATQMDLAVDRRDKSLGGTDMERHWNKLRDPTVRFASIAALMM